MKSKRCVSIPAYIDQLLEEDSKNGGESVSSIVSYILAKHYARKRYVEKK